VATENGIKHVPRDAKGQWNAEKVFDSLKKKGFGSVPYLTVIVRQHGPEAVELRARNPHT
jgi:hypothetical protein